jgi:putative Mn2+ efflux pump MntP
MKLPLLSIHLSHLVALVLFALIVSIAFGVLGRRRPKDRVKYAAWSFLLFLLVAMVIGWAMYPFSR